MRRAVFAWILIGIIFFVLYQQKDRMGDKPVQGTKTVQIELLQGDGGQEELLRPETLEIEAVTGNTRFQVWPDAEGNLVARGLEGGDYLLRARLQGREELRFLLHYRGQKKIRLLAREVKGDLPFTGLTDFTSGGKFSLLKAAEEFEAYMVGKRVGAQPLIVLPVGSQLLAQDSGTQLKGVAYTVEGGAALAIAGFGGRQLAEVTYPGELVEKVVVTDFDDDGQEDVISLSRLRDHPALKRVRLYVSRGQSVELLPLAAAGYLEGEKVYAGPKTLRTVTFLPAENMEGQGRYLLQEVKWHERDFTVNRYLSDYEVVR